MFPTIIVAVLFAIARFWIGLTIEPKKIVWVSVDSFKDAAHLFMGGLFVAAWVYWRPWQWWTFWLLVVVEVGVAVGSRLI